MAWEVGSTRTLDSRRGAVGTLKGGFRVHCT